MINQRIDLEKARLMLSHLAKAGRKLREREISQKRLGEQIDQLKKFSKRKDFKEDLKELENRIGTAIDNEQRIIQHQVSENAINRRLLDRIERLELKLSNYLKEKSQRASRIIDIELKVKEKSKAKKMQVEAIEKQVMLLEKLYEKIRKSGGYTQSDLLRVEEKISGLKSKVESIKR